MLNVDVCYIEFVKKEFVLMELKILCCILASLQAAIRRAEWCFSPKTQNKRHFYLTEVLLIREILQLLLISSSILVLTICSNSKQV